MTGLSVVPDDRPKSINPLVNQRVDRFNLINQALEALPARERKYLSF
jgi:hypothetical protein